jgi:PAS domain S-box-containing protein
MPLPSSFVSDARVAQWLAKAFDLASDGIALVSAEYTIVRVNRAWLAMRGFEPDEESEIVGRSLSSFHARAHVEGELVPFLARLTRAGAAQASLAQVRCDGEGFQTWTTAARVDGARAESPLYVLLSRDLSAERTAAQALRRTAGFLDSIVDNMPNLVSVKSASDLRYILMNRAGEELLGHAQADLVGKTDAEVFAAGEGRDSAEVDRQVLAGKGVVEIACEPVQTPHRGVRWVHTKKIPVFAGGDAPRYLLEIGEDITERRERAEAEAKLVRAEQAVKFRDEFLSVASHQLNNPLGAALLHAETLKRRAHEDGNVPPGMLRHIDGLHRVLTRMKMLVGELLDVSKLEAGRVALHREEFDLVELVRETIDTFADQLRGAGSELTVVAPDLVVGSWDRLRIGEIVANLVSNAINYGKGRPIEVSVATHPGRVRLEVRDHGIGMSPEEQRVVFRRFQRGESARSLPGSGLGLWIAEQMVLAHGGSICVASEPGRGATFTVDLPAVAVPPTSETP